MKILLTAISLYLFAGISRGQNLQDMLNKNYLENCKILTENGFSQFGTDVVHDDVRFKFEKKIPGGSVQCWVIRTIGDQASSLMVFTPNKAYCESLLTTLSQGQIEFCDGNDPRSYKGNTAGVDFIVFFQQFENAGGPVYELQVAVAE